MDDAEFAKLTPGRIVWAGVTDPQGRNPKVRPVIVLDRSAGNAPEAQFPAVCGSTQPPDPGNAGFAVRLNGTDRPGGHPRTGLRTTTWFYATWVRAVAVGDVSGFLRFCPDADLLQQRRLIAALDTPPADPAPPAPAESPPG